MLPEYDEWFFRRGRYDRGKDHKDRWEAKIKHVLDAIKKSCRGGDVLELACGRTPTWINFISNWLIQVPLAYLLSIYLDMGIGGCFIAIAATYITTSLVSVVAFRRGKWRVKEI